MESEVEETNEQATKVQEFKNDQQTVHMSEWEAVESEICPGSTEGLKLEISYLHSVIEEIEEKLLTLKAEIKRMYELKVIV